MTTAAIAPIWMIAVNAVMSASSMLNPSSVLGDRQVPGARDRQELGDALDHAEDDRFEDRHGRGRLGAGGDRVLPVSRARRTTTLLALAVGGLLASAPAAIAADGVGLYGRTDDKVVTFFAFGVIAFFAIFVTVATLIQMRLESRKERARDELERLRGP